MVNGGILRSRGLQRERTKGSVPSTVLYSSESLQYGADHSTVSYRSERSARSMCNPGKAVPTKRTVSSLTSTRSTASTVPYALDYEPSSDQKNELIPPAAQHSEVLSREQETEMQQMQSNPLKMISQQSQRATTAPSYTRPKDNENNRRLATAHGWTRGGHEPIYSPASTVVYEGCISSGNQVERSEGRKKSGGGVRAAKTEGGGDGSEGQGKAKKGVGLAVGKGEKGGERVVRLAQELWEFDAKHARLAKDLNKYMRGEKVRDPFLHVQIFTASG